MKTNIPALYRSEGYRVESIHVSETFGQVEMRWDNRFKPKHSACGGTMRICRKTFQMAIDMPLACNQATHLRYEAVQGFCGKCGMSETVRPLGIPPNGKATLRFMRHVSNLCRFIPASRVCEVIGLSGSSAWRYDRYILATELPPPSLDGVEALLIDEKHIGRKGGFVTVVLNAKTGELLHLGEGKGAEALEPFFAGLSEAQRSGILAVGIDRSNAYKAAVEAHLPNAEIVFDKFHVVANYNDVIDKVRRRSLAKANAQGRAFIKGQRYNLFRNPEKLSESGRQSLAMLLEANEEIWAAYVLKDGLKQIWNYTYRGWAEKSLLLWVSMAVETGISEVKRFARGLLKSKDGILSYCKHRITSAKIEAFNRTIQRVLYKTCGVKNMDYFFLKLRQESLQT